MLPRGAHRVPCCFQSGSSEAPPAAASLTRTCKHPPDQTHREITGRCVYIHGILQTGLCMRAHTYILVFDNGGNLLVDSEYIIKSFTG